MFHETERAEPNQRLSANVYVVPAAFLAGWLMMVGAIISAVGGRPALHSSIETVLRTPSPAPLAVPVTLAQR